MNLVCERKELAAGLQTVSHAVNVRSTLPILSNILFRVENETLTLTAYDMEIGLRWSHPVNVEEEGEVTLPASMLTDIVSRLPDGLVAVRLEPDTLKVEVTAGRSRYTVFGLAAEEFPVLPEVADEFAITVTAAQLASFIRRTAFAASREETRAIMTGVLMDVDEKTLRMVATDTHRLSLCQLELANPAPDRRQAIVPARAMTEFLRVLTDDETLVRIVIGETQVEMSIDNVCLVSRVIDGQFPDYTKVIPKEHQRRVVTNPRELETCVRRAEVVARNNNNKVVFSAEPETVVITAESPDVGTAHEEVTATLEGEPISLAFNAQYLLDFLNVVTADEVEIKVSGETNPVLMQPLGESDHQYVLMPMQV